MRIGASASISASAASNDAIASRRDGLEEQADHGGGREADASARAKSDTSTDADADAVNDDTDAESGNEKDECGIDVADEKQEEDDGGLDGINNTSRSDSSLR